MQQIIANIELTVKIIFDNLIDLVWSPIWTVYNIVNQSISVWKQQEEEEPEEPEQPTIVTQYPSANEGKLAEECDYPIGHKRIGFIQYDSKE